MEKTNSKIYINESQYKTEIKAASKYDIHLRTRVISDLAEAGNAEAIFDHGFSLFSGIWDTEKMSHDKACDQFLPPTEDAKADPYLVLPRNISKAVENMKLIADMPENVDFPLKYKARAILSYCQKEELAGFSAGDIKINYPKQKDELRYDIERILDDNAKSAVQVEDENKNQVSDVESSKFIPLPDVRPKITDPKVAMFKSIGEKSRDRCIFESIGAIIFFFLFSISLYFEGTVVGWTGFGISLIYAAVIFVLPLALFAKLFNDYGVRQKVPVCSCGKIHEAYKAGINGISGGSRAGFEDPFEKTPFLVKNLIFFKQLTLWLIGILTLVGFYCYVYYPKFHDIIDASRISGSLAIFVFVYSYILVLVDKKPPGCVELILGEGPAFVVSLVLYFFFFVLEDADCVGEVENYEKKKELKILQQTIFNE